MEAIVLMYHQIVPDEAPAGWVPSPLADSRYGVRLRDFSRQMAFLREEEFEVVPFLSFIEPSSMEKRSSDRPTIVLTFDDGYESDVRLAAPVLASFGYPATFFVSTGLLGHPGMMIEAMLRDLGSHPGFNLGGHGETHRFLSEMSDQECKGELQRSLETIRTLADHENIPMSAPGGRTSPMVASLARSTGFCALATSLPGVFSHSGELFSIPRLPVLHHHSLDTFAALLNPKSLAFRSDQWVRKTKGGVRSLLRGFTSKIGG